MQQITWGKSDVIKDTGTTKIKLSYVATKNKDWTNKKHSNKNKITLDDYKQNFIELA